MSQLKNLVHGLKWTTLSTVVIAVGGIIQIAVLVRLLPKSDFGSMALANLATGFAAKFLDLGFSNAIISKQEISDEQLSSLFWLNIISGLVLCVSILFLSPLLASFYNDPQLTAILTIVSATFIINAFGLQNRALLQKNLQFNALAIVEISSFLVGMAVSIGLSIVYKNVTALAYGAVLKAFTDSLLLSILNKYKKKLFFSFSMKNIGFFIKFGSFQLGEGILNYFIYQLDIILIGKFLGQEALGIYDITKRIAARAYLIVNPLFTKVFFPFMAKLQNEEVKLSTYYKKTINVICSINFAIYIFFIVLAQPLINLFLGVQWLNHINLWIILACNNIIITPSNPVGSLMLAKGRADMGFYWHIVALVVMPPAIFIGSLYGLNEVAFCLALINISLTWAEYFFLIKRLIPVNGLNYAQNIFQPLLISLCCGLPVFFMEKFYLIQLPIIINLLIGGIIFFALYGYATFKFNSNIVILLKSAFAK